jgi:hypothetical protein
VAGKRGSPGSGGPYARPNRALGSDKLREEPRSPPKSTRSRQQEITRQDADAAERRTASSTEDYGSDRHIFGPYIYLRPAGTPGHWRPSQRSGAPRTLPPRGQTSFGELLRMRGPRDARIQASWLAGPVRRPRDRVVTPSYVISSLRLTMVVLTAVKIGKRGLRCRAVLGAGLAVTMRCSRWSHLPTFARLGYRQSVPRSKRLLLLTLSLTMLASPSNGLFSNCPPGLTEAPPLFSTRGTEAGRQRWPPRRLASHPSEWT